MLKYALTYGAIAGFITIGAMVLSFALSGGAAHAGGQWAGYLIMLVALSLVFVATKRYRDIDKGGVIKFLPAFLVGLGVAGVAGVAYVAAWEVYLAVTDYAFIDEYAAGVLAAKQEAGVTGAALAAEAAKLDDIKAAYANPFTRVPITFLEIFPVGLLVALVSAAILRNPRVLPRR